ncbi:CMRF35-like molecule 8 isoform X1 [Nerophis lumbriciformis]|uniref:CMRF35-like molecule 8 isoform X1 n=1 Tax=Nerophis lumbriciformis TaxID=546530 RepID=UPI003BAC6EEE
MATNSRRFGIWRIRVIIFFLCAGAWTGGVAVNVKGLEGAEVSFQCQHQYASQSTKYLCRAPCKTQQHIVARVQPGKKATQGKLCLEDAGNGVFNVTFKQLRLSDSGTYWCGVERLGLDTYIEVKLQVKAVGVHPAVGDHATTSVPIRSITYWTTSTSAQTTPEMDLGANWPTAAFWYGITGAGAVLFTLVVAGTFRKCRSRVKPQAFISNSADNVVDEEENVYVNTKEPRSIKRNPAQTFSDGHQSHLDSPTHPIYANVIKTKYSAGSTCSAAKVQHLYI